MIDVRYSFTSIKHLEKMADDAEKVSFRAKHRLPTTWESKLDFAVVGKCSLPSGKRENRTLSLSENELRSDRLRFLIALKDKLQKILYRKGCRMDQSVASEVPDGKKRRIKE